MVVKVQAGRPGRAAPPEEPKCLGHDRQTERIAASMWPRPATRKGPIAYRKLRMPTRCSRRLTWDFSSSVAGCRGYTMRRGIGIPSSSKALFWVGVGSVS